MNLKYPSLNHLKIAQQSDILFKVTTCILAVVALYAFFNNFYYLQGIVPAGDELWFSKHEIGFDYFYLRYNTWSSRLLIETAVIFFSHHYSLFFIALGISYLSLPFAFFIILNSLWPQLAFHKINSFVLCVAISIFIPYFELTSAGIIATATNYYLPMVSMSWLVALLFTFKRFSICKAITVALLGLFAFNHEQYGLFGFLLLVPLYLSKKTDRKLFVVIAVIAILSLIFHLTCPGNNARLHQEINWLPEFAFYSLLDKLSLGIVLFAERIAVFNKIIVYVLTFSILLSSLFKVSSSFKQRIFFVLLSIFVVYLLKLVIADVPDVLLKSKDAIFDNVSLKFITASVLYFAILFIVFCAGGKQKFTNIALSYTLCVSIAVTVLISWSPTMFASGLRTGFLFASVACFIALALLHSLDKLSLKLLCNVALLYAVFENLRYIEKLSKYLLLAIN